MPFFQSITKKYLSQHLRCVTLQVHVASEIAVKSEKRVWLSASLTIEAALSLSLFVFASMIMMVPMKMMDNHRRLQGSLEAYGEEISQMAYLLYINKNQDQDGTEEGLGAAAELAAGTYGYHKATKYVEEGLISGISFLRSHILEDGETVCLVMDYQMNMPFSVFHISRFPMSAVTYRRAYVGKKGRLGAGDNQEQEDRIVYVGKGSTRYHLLSTCHYLDNQIISCKTEEVGQMRNQYGGKYSSCSVCGKMAEAGGTVFVLPSGSSYHGRVDCSAISAFVKAVPLSEVAHLGACSYCSGK